MKKLVIMLSMISLVLSCDDKDVSLSEESVELQPTIDGIAKELASNNSWLTDEVYNAMRSQNKAPLEMIKPGSTTLNKSGIEYAVVVEPYFRTRNHLEGLKKGSGNGKFRVALDPDIYYVPEEIDDLRETQSEIPSYEIPTYVFDGHSEPKLESVSIGSDVQYSEPIFFVTFYNLTERRRLSKASDNPSEPEPGIYLTFLAARLKVKRDDSNEEFELFTATGLNYADDPFRSSTTELFDGYSVDERNVRDVSGRLRIYPDLEYHSTNMTPADSAIAILKLDNTSTVHRIAAIENDNPLEDGVYDRTKGKVGDKITTMVQYYDMARSSDQIVSHTSGYKIGRIYAKNDDRYVNSGVSNINNTNLEDRLNGSSFFETDNATGQTHVLIDINWRLGRTVY